MSGLTFAPNVAVCALSNGQTGIAIPFHSHFTLMCICWTSIASFRVQQVQRNSCYIQQTPYYNGCKTITLKCGWNCFYLFLFCYSSISENCSCSPGLSNGNWLHERTIVEKQPTSRPTEQPKKDLILLCLPSFVLFYHFCLHLFFTLPLLPLLVLPSTHTLCAIIFMHLQPAHSFDIVRQSSMLTRIKSIKFKMDTIDIKCGLTNARRINKCIRREYIRFLYSLLWSLQRIRNAMEWNVHTPHAVTAHTMKRNEERKHKGRIQRENKNKNKNTLFWLLLVLFCYHHLSLSLSLWVFVQCTYVYALCTRCGLGFRLQYIKYEYMLKFVYADVDISCWYCVLVLLSLPLPLLYGLGRESSCARESERTVLLCLEFSASPPNNQS